MTEIKREKLWTHYEVKACLLKYSDNDKVWKVAFLFVWLPHDKSPVPIPSLVPELKRLKIVHEVLPIDNLQDLLYQISSGQNLRIGGIDSSLELIDKPLKYELYWNQHPFTAMFGISDPCYGLSASGDYSSKLDNTLEHLRSELPTLSFPFQDLYLLILYKIEAELSVD
jgi:hypothetical protein